MSQNENHHHGWFDEDDDDDLVMQLFDENSRSQTSSSLLEVEAEASGLQEDDQAAIFSSEPQVQHSALSVNSARVGHAIEHEDNPVIERPLEDSGRLLTWNESSLRFEQSARSNTDHVNEGRRIATQGTNAGSASNFVSKADSAPFVAVKDAIAHIEMRAPFLSTDDALAWKAWHGAQEKGSMSTSETELAYADSAYWKRLTMSYKDKLFTIHIDNSPSMARMWDDVIACTSFLAFCMARYAPEVDLSFSHGDEGHHILKPELIALRVEEVRRSRASADNLLRNHESFSFVERLHRTCAALSNSKALPNGSRHRKRILFTLTDGLSIQEYTAIKSIERLLDTIHKECLPSDQIVVHIIQFGNDHAAVETLSKLEEHFSPRMIDVEPWPSGNVWKILLGAIPTGHDTAEKTTDEEQRPLENFQAHAANPVVHENAAHGPESRIVDESTSSMQDHGLAWQKVPSRNTAGTQVSRPSSISTFPNSDSDQPRRNQGQSTQPTSVSEGLQSATKDDDVDPSSVTIWKYEHNPAHNEDVESDLWSVVSAEDDISSQTASSRGPSSEDQQAAVFYFVGILTKDSELFALYRDAARSMERDKFVRNHRRLLKQLHLRLRSTDLTPVRMSALNFLRSRYRRDDISSSIYSTFDMAEDMIRSEIKLMIRKEKPNLALLNRYLEGLGSATAPDEHETEGKTEGAESEVNNDIVPETDDDSASDSGDDVEAHGDLGKLKEAANFITTGQEFDEFKLDLRAFIYQNRPNVDITDDGGKPLQQKGFPKPSKVEYSIIPPPKLATAISESVKLYVESIAGSKLSWWPLTNTADKLRPDHVRIYSAHFRDRSVYEDIPITSAKSLFPSIEDDDAARLVYLWKSTRRAGIVLYKSTLFEVLSHNEGTSDNRHEHINVHPATQPGGSTGNQPTVSPQTHSNAPGHTAGPSSSTQSSGAHPTAPTASAPLSAGGTNMSGSHNPVLFISINLNPNESVARAIKLGLDDKTTVQGLRKEYRKLRAQWFRVKHITGVKFYRFKSFLFKHKHDVHYVELHNDKERYPIDTDPEYSDYQYTPQPWPSGLRFPGKQVWYYLNNPEDCGTSISLRNQLPVNIKGSISSQTRAFGIHFEEHYSVWVIVLPSFLVALLFLVPTGWFVRHWMDLHPGDLQGAAVPVSLGVALLSLVINMHMSLLLFRWTAAK